MVIKTTIQSSSGKIKDLELPLIVLSVEERKKIAIKNLGLFWGIALFCLFLPLVHFIAFPFFTLFAPFIAWKKYQQTEHIGAMEFNCPECNAQIQPKQQVAKNPLLITCPHCRYNLKALWR